MLLKEVAKRLNSCVRETDTVARLGGDEFVIVLTDLPQAGDVTRMCRKNSVDSLARPVDIGGARCVCDGQHWYFDCTRATVTTVKYCCVTPTLPCTASRSMGATACASLCRRWVSSAISRLNMEGAMRRGWSAGNSKLHYQPKIDLATQRIVGAEALVRWQHPQIGLVHPIEFISLAEESGLILPLGEWVLGRGLQPAG
jgi:predicted signal transduction protein with EAL and GGDEF domain